MDVTFFASKADCDVSCFEEIPEGSIIGGGHFNKALIGDLLSCFNCAGSTLSDCLWLLPINFSEELSTIDDNKLKNISVDWADESSWGNKNVNAMDLAGHLLELKYGYLQHSDKRIFVLFQ